MEMQTLTVGAMAGMPDDEAPIYETDSEADPYARMDSDECDMDLLVENPMPEVMELLDAHEKGILALYADYRHCPMRYGPHVAPHHPIMIACGKWMARQ